MIEKVIVKTEKSKIKFIQEIDYDIGDSLLITTWLLELPNKRIRSFKKEKTLKGTKGEKKEIYSIGNNNQKGLNYCIVEVKKFRVSRKFWRRIKRWKLLKNVLQKLLIISFEILCDDLI